jgi:hypothetical protein
MICLTLAACLLVVPGLIHWLFGIEAVSESLLMARRAGFLFVGLSGLYWSVRELSASSMRNGVAKGSILMLMGLALLGLWELGFGIAGPGILLAISTEVVLAVLFGSTLMRDRETVTTDSQRFETP